MPELPSGKDMNERPDRVRVLLFPSAELPHGPAAPTRRVIGQGTRREAGTRSPAGPRGSYPPYRRDSQETRQIYEAVAAWDEFVDSSSVAFLAAPPDEMLAIRVVLSRLDYAAIEHAARDGDTGHVDAWGLACAAVSPAPEPVVEVPFEVCVLADGDFRTVSGVYLPAGGDSLVEVGGARRPLREAWPDRAGYAAGAPSFARDVPITVGGREYRQWGMSRVVRPGELMRAGELAGVPVFVAPGERTPPDVILLPFRGRCEVQPYRRTTEISKVRG